MYIGSRERKHTSIRCKTYCVGVPSSFKDITAFNHQHSPRHPSIQFSLSQADLAVSSSLVRALFTECCLCAYKDKNPIWIEVECIFTANPVQPDRNRIYKCIMSALRRELWRCTQWLMWFIEVDEQFTGKWGRGDSKLCWWGPRNWWSLATM